jgi:restriction system protein
MGFWADMQREADRQRAAQLREQRRAQREWERAQREAERQAAREEKERKRLYVEMRAADVDRMNADLANRVEELEGVLAATLSVDDYIDLEGLKQAVQLPQFEPGALARPKPEPELDLPERPRGIGALVPGAKTKHEQAVEAARTEHEHQLAQWRTEEAQRMSDLAAAEARHSEDAKRAEDEIAIQHADVERFRSALEAGDPAAIVDYFGLVLEASRYPPEFPKTHKLAFVPESKQLVLEYELPSFDLVPEEKAFKYVKARDEISSTARPATQRRALYANVIAQTSLRCVHELFEADRNGLVETIAFNGMVDTIDKRTGQPTRVCLVTLRTTRDAFDQLNLGMVDPQECLRGLNAAVSKQPSELAPVRPVMEFKMVDARFTDESDVISTLDQRPNLMELTPGEFESLITNLFEKMGLETRQTRPSRDGGVDCVAWDTRPIMGGKVVIQAKRYKNTVGVSAVRDLFGTVHNEGAGKGILVTTSGYGKASFEFSEGKPLELLDGTHLLYLLREHAEIEARIEPPEDWVDPDGALTA